MFESKEWLAKANARGHDFVDPEVGQMALAAVETGLEFGYLHIISDNVAQKYDEDLSNERLKGVLYGRDRLYKDGQPIAGNSPGQYLILLFWYNAMFSRFEPRCPSCY